MTNDATQPAGSKPADTDAPKRAKDLDLTPEGLANEPAKQEDPDSLVEPENS
jgi:hypothetical protein